MPIAVRVDIADIDLVRGDRPEQVWREHLSALFLHLSRQVLDPDVPCDVKKLVMSFERQELDMRVTARLE